MHDLPLLFSALKGFLDEIAGKLMLVTGTGTYGIV